MIYFGKMGKVFQFFEEYAKSVSLFFVQMQKLFQFF